MKANPIISAIRFNKFFWIIFSLIIISNLLFCFTIGRSQRNKIEELQNQYRTKRTIKVAQKDDDLSKLLQAKQDVQYFIDQLGIRSEFPTVINELFQILHQNGLSVNKMTYNPELIEFRNLLKFTTSAML